MMIFELLTLAVLLLIAYDDLRYRSVRVILFVLLAGLLFYLVNQRILFQELVFNWLYNSIYIFFLLCICFLYLRIKYKTYRIFSYLGLGDILFLMCLSVWFDPVQFILFNTFSFIAALIVHFFLSSFLQSFDRLKTVPLAGYQSLCFAVVVIMGSV